MLSPLYIFCEGVGLTSDLITIFVSLAVCVVGWLSPSDIKEQTLTVGVPLVYSLHKILHKPIIQMISIVTSLQFVYSLYTIIHLTYMYSLYKTINLQFTYIWYTIRSLPFLYSFSTIRHLGTREMTQTLADNWKTCICTLNTFKYMLSY